MYNILISTTIVLYRIYIFIYIYIYIYIYITIYIFVYKIRCITTLQYDYVTMYNVMQNINM